MISTTRRWSTRPRQPDLWPARLWIVRHGQSAGNVARDAALASGQDRIALDIRDVDVPLSELGHQQARALGQWFATLAPAQRPEVLLASPYVRARQTAELFRDSGGAALPGVPICADERLREKEFGILDGLTTQGILRLHPEQAAFRKTMGKFYHRSPGGESWCDVILRLRALLDTVCMHHAGQRVMIVAHQVIVLCFRYILEGLDEASLLAIDREGDVANCGVTEYAFQPTEHGDGQMALVGYNATYHLTEQDAPVTRSPDAMVAARG